MVEVRILRYSIQHTPFTLLLALQRNCLSNWIIYSPFLKTVLAGRDFLNFVSDSNFFPVVSKSLMKFRETTLCRSLLLLRVHTAIIRSRRATAVANTGIDTLPVHLLRYLEEVVV